MLCIIKVLKYFVEMKYVIFVEYCLISCFFKNLYFGKCGVCVCIIIGRERWNNGVVDRFVRNRG